MGAADIVPGVSGGTMALILGIYQQLLASLTAINLKKPFQSINWAFFIPLGLGILTAIFMLSGTLHQALTQYPGPTYSFFFGLIFISGLVILRQVSAWTATVYLALFIGVLAAYLFIGLNPLASNHALPAIFISGTVAIMAMMLPGVSGSFLLLILGQYEYILGAIHDRDIIVLATLASGCLLGLLAFSHFLNYLLTRYHDPTLAFLIGMIFGSLRLPFSTITATNTPLPTIITFIVIGASLVLIIEYFGRRRQPVPTPEGLKH